MGTVVHVSSSNKDSLYGKSYMMESSRKKNLCLKVVTFSLFFKRLKEMS